MALEATRDSNGTLVDVIDRILDKGLVINADITVSVAGVELLGENCQYIVYPKVPRDRLP